MSDPIDHKAIYQAIENPIQKARYLEQHQREIYPAPAPMPETRPGAAPADMNAAASFKMLQQSNPVRAAEFMARNQAAVVRGLEAHRGVRDMPRRPNPRKPNPPDGSNPPPLPGAA